MTTKYKGSHAERRALDAYIKLSRAAETVEARVERQLAATGLPPTHLGVLDALLHLGPLCQNELGTKMLRSPGNITAAVDRLERDGLVRRERSVEDRRIVHVYLTPHGRKLVTGTMPGHVAEISRAMSVLTPAEQDELGLLCRKLGLAVSAMSRAGGAARGTKIAKGLSRTGRKRS